MAAAHGVRCAPHNWGSLLGFYLSLQFGKTIPHFLYGEVATLTSDVIDTSNYTFDRWNVHRAGYSRTWVGAQ